jgi:hypothetical protein
LTLPELKQKILHELEKKEVFIGDTLLPSSQELESRVPNKKVTFMEPAEKAVV